MSYIIWIATTLLYSPILIKLYRSRWEKIDYTHAYFILPISLWLAWRSLPKLKELIKNPPKSNIFTSLSIFILGLFMLVFGWRQDYFFISTLSLIPFLCGMILYLYGTEAMKILSFPVFYLLLMIPPPLGVLDSITIPMRYASSIISEIILKTFNYPILRDGLMLSIGKHDIYMGPACSGFRSLITLFSLGLVYAYINQSSFKKRAILVLSIIPLALLGNLIRIISTCLVTFYLGETIGHKYHDIGGFAIFVILILGLIAIDSLLNKQKPKHENK